MTNDAWEAVGAGAGTLTSIIVTFRMVAGYWFKQQIKVEEAREKASIAQERAVEAEKKVYEFTISQTVKEFNELRASVKNEVNRYLEVMGRYETQVQNLNTEFEGIKKELHAIVEMFKTYKETTEKRLTAVEGDFGKVIVKEGSSGKTS